MQPGYRLPDVTFHTRVRDDAIEGPNPFKWEDKTTADYFAGKRVVLFSPAPIRSPVPRAVQTYAAARFRKLTLSPISPPEVPKTRSTACSASPPRPFAPCSKSSRRRSPAWTRLSDSERRALCVASASSSAANGLSAMLCSASDNLRCWSAAPPLAVMRRRGKDGVFEASVQRAGPVAQSLLKHLFHGASPSGNRSGLMLIDAKQMRPSPSVAIQPL